MQWIIAKKKQKGFANQKVRANTGKKRDTRLVKNILNEEVKNCIRGILRIMNLQFFIFPCIKVKQFETIIFSKNSNYVKVIMFFSNNI